MNVKIRKAELTDLDQLLKFEQGVIATERPFDKSLKDSEINYYDIEGLIAKDNSQLVVAESGGELVGSGYASILKSKTYEKYEFFSYLGFMYVVPEYRGMGINKLIMDFLIDWSKTKGIMEIRLEVFDQNESAVRAYEKIGFTKATVKMRMDAS